MYLLKERIRKLLGKKIMDDIVRDALEPYKEQVIQLEYECSQLANTWVPLVVIYEQLLLRIEANTFIISNPNEKEYITRLVSAEYHKKIKHNDYRYEHIF